MDQKTKSMTKAKLLKRLKGVPLENRNAVACAMTRHSRLRTFCFGYNYCGRCGAQLGDSLGGSFKVTDEVIQGHDGSQAGCVCAKNFKAMTWEDTLFVENAKTWTKATR